MSAKRMKTPLAPQERRLAGLPIPSFSNAVDTDDVAAHTSISSPIHTQTPTPTIPSPPTTTTTTTTIEPHWNKDRLLKIEVALQLHVKSQQRQRQRESTGRLLPLSEFYAFTQKVSSHASSLVSDTATATATVSPLSSVLTDLSTAERDTYDLLCAASPSLYKLVQMNRQELPAWKYASKQIVDNNTNATAIITATATATTTSKTDEKPKVWCLQVVPVTGNRMQALQKMLAVTALEESKSQGILRVIRAYRDDQKQQTAEARSSAVADSNSKPVAAVESFLRPGMNIDERVRARADAKENYREQLEAKAALVSQSGGTNTETDRTWLVRLADSLWFHSSHIMKRQDHFQSSKDKKKGSACVLTLKDIVEVLSRPAATTSSRVPMHVNKSEKLTKREIVKAVQELRDLVPDWIHFVDTENQKGRLSKDTTVWLKPVDYQGVRARLTGHPEQAAGAGGTASLPIWKRPPSLSGARPQPGGSLVQPRPLNKRPFATPAEGTLSRGSIVMDERTDESLEHSTLHPLVKKTRIEVPRAENKLPPVSVVAGVKRTAPDVPSTPPVQNKKSRGLRINPNLILTDADYTGGEVIQPTPFDSPRGLKILFSQMNSGKRI